MLLYRCQTVLLEALYIKWFCMKAVTALQIWSSDVFLGCFPCVTLSYWTNLVRFSCSYQNEPDFICIHCTYPMPSLLLSLCSSNTPQRKPSASARSASEHQANGLQPALFSFHCSHQWVFSSAASANISSTFPVYIMISPSPWSCTPAVHTSFSLYWMLRAFAFLTRGLLCNCKFCNIF